MAGSKSGGGGGGGGEVARGAAAGVVSAGAGGVGAAAGVAAVRRSVRTVVARYAVGMAIAAVFLRVQWPPQWARVVPLDSDVVLSFEVMIIGEKSSEYRKAGEWIENRLFHPPPRSSPRSSPSGSPGDFVSPQPSASSGYAPNQAKGPRASLTKTFKKSKSLEQIL